MLGIDFGSKQIGLAVGETEHEIVTIRPPLRASGKLSTDAQAIAKIAKREEINVLILGLPINPDGTDNRMEKVCRKLGSELAQCGLEVHFVDETLTSVGSEQLMRDAGLKLSQRNHARDSEAAARIIERYIDGQEIE